MTVEGGPHGWLVIDKPVGLTSNRVCELIRRYAKTKVGHAGTLDPLATGVLPIAIGEATKMVSYAMAGQKRYRFVIRWGVARATDDREGAITSESSSRPTPAAIEAILPRFVGTIRQRPPSYSAIKINGERSYKLARAAATPMPPARLVEIAELRLIAVPDRDHAECEAVVGKGTYIRALARDLGIALGTLAYIEELRRLSVGRFTENQAIALDSIAEQGHITANCGYLLPLETALDGIPAQVLTGAQAARLRNGQRVKSDDIGNFADFGGFGEGAVVGAWHGHALVALARIEGGCLRPIRVLNR
jgi:tRNA pseudouridine55 synthase